MSSILMNTRPLLRYLSPAGYLAEMQEAEGFKSQVVTIREIKGHFNTMTQLILETGVKFDTCKTLEGHDFLQVVFTFEVLEPDSIASI